MDIVTSLKDFTARITTAEGDPTAVPGQSICEVLDYAYKNLNVNADGKLIVTNLKKNLLSAAVTIKASTNPPANHAEIGALGLELGKSYVVKGTYDGVPFEATKATFDANGGYNVGVEGGVTIGNMTQANAILLTESVFLVVCDKATMGTDSWLYSDSSALIMVSDRNSQGVKECIIESIKEV